MRALPRSWRFWLVDLPADLTDIGLAWYRLILTLPLVIGATIVPVMVLTSLALWFGFGIRWGW
jgi:hypothetical protein